MTTKETPYFCKDIAPKLPHISLHSSWPIPSHIPLFLPIWNHVWHATLARSMRTYNRDSEHGRWKWRGRRTCQIGRRCFHCRMAMLTTEVHWQISLLSMAIWGSGHPRVRFWCKVIYIAAEALEDAAGRAAIDGGSSAVRIINEFCANRFQFFGMVNFIYKTDVYALKEVL